ncbi:MAG: VOC family protein [Thermoplasmatota archaeon]
MANAVVHFEIPTDNLERAQKFYEKAFGWKMNAIPGMGYVVVHTAPTDAKGMVQQAGAINGGLLARGGPVKVPLVTIDVPDVEAALKRVEQNGGKVIQAKREVPGVGFSGYAQDSEGNMLGVFQSTRR